MMKFKIYYLTFFLTTLSLLAYAQGTLESESPEANFEILNFNFTVNVVDADTRQSIPVRLEVNEATNNQAVFSQQVNTGSASLQLSKQKNYNLKVSADKYLDTLVAYQPSQDTSNTTTILLQPRKIVYEINVSDMETGEGLPFGVTLTNKNRSEVIEVNPEDGKDGKYRVSIREDDEYELEVKNPKDYIFYSNTINKKGEKEDKLEVKIHKLVVGAKIPLYNITFETASWILNDNSKRELDRIVKLLEDNPTAIIEIAAHTDSQGSDAANMVLSQKRAQSVFEYLVAKKIFAKRFVSKGYGETQPIASNDTEEGRAKNRRFELIVLSL